MSEEITRRDEDATQAIEQTGKVDSRRRQVFVAQLLRSGYSDDEIFELVKAKFAKSGVRGFDMDRTQLREAIYKVYASWAQEDEDRAPYVKTMAVRRLYKHIQDASRDEKWSAVANMEKVLAMIQGTIEEPDKRLPQGDRWADLAVAKAAQMDPEKFREIVENQRKFNEAQQSANEPLKIAGVAQVKEKAPVPASEND